MFGGRRRVNKLHDYIRAYRITSKLTGGGQDCIVLVHAKGYFANIA